MEFFEAVKRRHSIRAFQPKEIEKEKVEKLLFAANSAPSAGDLQAYQIYQVKKNSQRAALAKAAYGQDFVARAPVDLVFCIDPLRSARKYGKRARSFILSRTPRSRLLMSI